MIIRSLPIELPIKEVSKWDGNNYIANRLFGDFKASSTWKSFSDFAIFRFFRAAFLLSWDSSIPNSSQIPPTAETFHRGAISFWQQSLLLLEIIILLYCDFKLYAFPAPIHLMKESRTMLYVLINILVDATNRCNVLLLYWASRSAEECFLLFKHFCIVTLYQSVRKHAKSRWKAWTSWGRPAYVYWV